MSATIKIWSNGIAPTCEDVDLNGFKSENNNLIIGAGIGLSTADNQQTHKAVAHYAGVGDFYVDSGSGTAYILTTTGSQVAPPTYATGMRIRFRAGNVNTGAATINVAGLGVKSIIVDDDGTALIGGEVTLGLNEAYYDGTDFRLILSQGQSGIWSPEAKGGTVPGTGWVVNNGNHNWTRQGKLLTLTFKLDITTVSGDATGNFVMVGPTGFSAKAVASVGSIVASLGIPHTTGYTSFSLDPAANDLSILNLVEDGHVTSNARIYQISDFAGATANLVGTLSLILD